MEAEEAVAAVEQLYTIASDPTNETLTGKSKTTLANLCNPRATDKLRQEPLFGSIKFNIQYEIKNHILPALKESKAEQPVQRASELSQVTQVLKKYLVG